MTLGLFVAFVFGILVELVFLWDRSHPSQQDQIVYQGDKKLNAIVPLAIAAVISYGLFAVLGIEDNETFLDHPLLSGIAVIFMLAVMFYGFISTDLLPSINEQTITTTHTVVIVSIVIIGLPSVPSVLTVIIFAAPTLTLTYLGFAHLTLHPITKSLLYLWYLILLIIVMMQNSTLDYFQKLELSLTEAAITGAIFVFLMLHTLFFLRFFLIVSSLILPRNRPYIEPFIVTLFSDVQLSPFKFSLFISAIIGFIILNRVFGIIQDQTAVNIAVLISAQLLGAKNGLFTWTRY